MTKCPICGKEFPTEHGMHVHMTVVHGENSWVKHGYDKLTNYDEETIEWCNKRSTENLLLRIHAHIDNLTFRETRSAKKYGLTKLVGIKNKRGTKVVLTPKARELLTRMKIK